MEKSNVCSLTTNAMTNNNLPLQNSDPTHDYVSKMILQIHAENSQILDEFVTEDEVADSISRKDNDSVSLDGSCASGASGTLSGISTCSAFSLSALKTRKNQLINSIKSQLNSSTCSENTLSTPDTSLLNENVCTSTPFRESVPPAAKFLKEWKSSFVNYEDIQSANEEDDDDDYRGKSGIATKYEEAFSSLREILSNSQDNILDAYENTLDAYKTVNDKKFDEMLNFFSNVNEEFITVDIDETLKDNTLRSDSNDNTIVAELINTSENKTDFSEEVKIVNVDLNKEVLESVTDDEKETDIKDPENLIIGGEEVAAEITPVDEERLLASDDELPEDLPKADVPGVVKDLEIFISNDEDENRDNNDPKWNFLRNLGSDYERFQFVHRLWNNLGIPNPKKDLTCRCRGTSNLNGITASSSTFNTIENASRKRVHSPTFDNQKRKKARRESCTMLYDRSIEMLIREVEEEKSRLEYEQEMALNRLAECQQLEQISLYQQRANQREVLAMKIKHFQETKNLIRDFRNRYDSLMETSKQKIGVLRQAACEVREFHEFYPDSNENNEGDKNSLVYLTDVEVEEILEIETMLIRFENFYDRPTVS